MAKDPKDYLKDLQKSLSRIPPNRFPRLILTGAALLLFGYAATHSIFLIEGGHRGVVFSKFVGVKNRIYGEGIHFMIPWIEKPEIFSIRSKVHKLLADTPSKDLQMISLSIRLMFHPQPENLPNIYRILGKDYEDRVLKSILPEVVKSTVAQFNAYELINQRENVSGLIKKRLAERSNNFWIAIDEVSITDLNFGTEYLQAVEAKQVAQQEAERAKFIVERARLAKEEIIVKAQGEAKAATLFNAMLKSDKQGNFLTLRRIEAAKDIAHALSQSNNRIYLDSSNLMFSNIHKDPIEELAGNQRQ